MFSARRDYPDAWYRFLNPPASQPDVTLDLDLALSRFPYQPSGGRIQIDQIQVIVVTTGAVTAAGLQAQLACVVDAITTIPATAPPPATFQDDTSLAGLAAMTYAPGTGSGPGIWRLTIAAAGNAGVGILQTGTPAGTARLDPTIVYDVLVLCSYER
jgi:hypothetical protein